MSALFRLVAATAAALAVGVGLAGAAPTASIDLLAAARPTLPTIKRATRVPVILPARLLLGGSPLRVYVSGGGARAGWVLTVAGVPRCGGATACFVASFAGDRGRRLPGRSNVRLRGGVRGLYQPISCGASCSPASLWFVRGSVLYSWQVKDPPQPVRASLVRMANAALAAGPR